MQTELNKLVHIEAGYPFRTSLKETASPDAYAVQLKNTNTRDGVDWSGCTPVKLPGKRQPTWLANGDLLLPARGMAPGAVLIANLPRHWEERVVASPHFFVLRVHSNQVLPEFLAWYINQRPAQRYLWQNRQGSAVGNLRRKTLESLGIQLPPLTEQRSITKLAQLLYREQQVLEQLLQTHEKIFTAIVQKLHTDT